MSAPALKPALFLDRDGVVVENRDDYVKSLDEVRFIPGALQALAAVAASDCRIVVVTNQSSIGRGLVPPDVAARINAYIWEQVTLAGGRLDALYVCPHAPEAGCACRKPEPGLLLQAAAELGLDLSASVIVGDAVSDVLAGQRVGALAVLVKTGRGQAEALDLTRLGLGAVPVAADLADALTQIAALKAWLTKTPPIEGGVSAHTTAGILP